MQIRRKISIIFTALTSVVLIFSSLFIYFFSEYYTKNDFFTRLQEKAYLIADKYFEQDELSKQVYEKIMEKNSKSLPEAFEIVLDTKNPKLVRDSLNKIIPEQIINKLLSGQNVKFNIEEKQCVGLYYPDNQGTFIIIVTAVDKIGIKKQQNLLKILLGIFFGSIVFVYFIGQFYARQVLSPVGHILKNVKKIRATNLKLRLAGNNGADELAELTRMLNQMLDRLEHSFDLQKNFISNASHELKNPLTAILGETEIALSKKRSSEEYIITLNKIAAEAERLDLLTRNLLNLAQADFEISELNHEKIRVDELLWEIKDYFDKTENKNRLVFHISNLPDDPEYLSIYGINNLLKTAIINLIDNACKFSGIQLVDIMLKEDNGYILLTISDKGIGIPENELNNLFQPFFRATNAFSYKGSGIGLSLADKIIKLHGGNIVFSTTTGKGTKVEIRFTALTNISKSHSA